MHFLMKFFVVVFDRLQDVVSRHTFKVAVGSVFHDPQFPIAEFAHHEVFIFADPDGGIFLEALCQRV